jgi:hypothetical protein
VRDELANDNKVHFHQGTGCRFAGCVRKAVELTSGELGACLGGVSDTRLRDKRLSLIAQQNSAEA